MGASFGGVAIKVDPSHFNALDVIKHFEQQEFLEIQLGEINKTRFDIRKDDCFAVYKTKGAIWILNKSTSNYFFEKDNNTIIQNYLDYFGQPEMIVAFSEYDIISTYGFAVVEKGELIRTRKSSRFETNIDFEIPLLQEQKWLNGKTSIQTIDGKQTLIYHHPTDINIMYNELSLTQIILSELTQDYFGFSTWDIDLFATERKFFKIDNSEPDTQVNKNEYKNSWFKKIFRRN